MQILDNTAILLVTEGQKCANCIRKKIKLRHVVKNLAHDKRTMKLLHAEGEFCEYVFVE